LDFVNARLSKKVDQKMVKEEEYLKKENK